MPFTHSGSERRDKHWVIRYWPGSPGCPEHSAAKVVKWVRFLAVGVILILLSLVVLEDPKGPLASLRQGKGIRPRRESGEERWGADILLDPL